MLLANFLISIKQNIAQAEGEIQITTWAELHAIRNNLAGDYILMNDLDETTEGYATYAGPIANAEVGWDPIGDSTVKFTGSFDGGGFVISELNINRLAEDYVGLFGYIDGADLTNIILEDSNIVGRNYVGSLVGYSNNSSIFNSYSTGSASASDDYIGGLVGYSNNGSISNSYFSGSVSGSIYFSDRVGGLVGHNNNISISNSYSTGAVSGAWYVGGLVGLNYGPISNSYSTGSVFASVNYVGGLVAYNFSSVNYSFWDINTSGQETSAGGTGKTTAEMKTLATFTTELGENSWDFADTWAMGNGRNSGYPYLQSIPPEVATHTLTYVAGDNGSITGDSPQTINDGENGTAVTAVPDEGYVFVNWNDDSTSNPRTDTSVTEDITVTANFTAEEFCGEGDGSEESPYEICDWNNLNNIRDHLSSHFILMNDLDDLTEGYAELASSTANAGAGWDPIGTWGDRFEGSFDGNGNKISNLFINMPDESELGLFGFAGVNANISNIVLEDVDIFGSTWIGGLVGLNRGSVSNSSTTGSVSGAFNFIGGLIGSNDRGSISNSYSASSVSGDDSIGGLIGKNWGSVSNSYSTGSVSGDDNVGGLIGENYSSSISNSYSAGSVSGYSDVGGLVGYNSGDSTVLNSFWDINTSGQEASILGIGKTTAEMKTVSTFTDWDFIDVWTINSTDNNGYPALAWQGFENEEGEEQEENDSNEPDRAKITSWSAYKYVEERGDCRNKLKLTIKGKHFDDDAKVFIGGREASSVDVKSSKKLTAKFCLDKLLDSKTDHKKIIYVKNPDTKKTKAKKQIDLDNILPEFSANDSNPQSPQSAKDIQTILAKLGYLDSQYITNIYGPITTESVKKFQADNGIEATGFVGPLTRDKLEEKNR